MSYSAWRLRRAKESYAEDKEKHDIHFFDRGARSDFERALFRMQKALFERTFVSFRYG